VLKNVENKNERDMLEWKNLRPKMEKLWWMYGGRGGVNAPWGNL